VGTAFLLKNAQQMESLIKSIQHVAADYYGGTETSFDITINAVDVNNSIIIWNGIAVAGNNSGYMTSLGRLTLVNSTTVNLSRHAADRDGGVINFVVVEFNPGVVKSKQSGTIDLAAGANSNTCAISAVDLNKTLLAFCGNNITSASAAGSSSFARLELTNVTTITATRQLASHAMTVNWNLIEFY